MIKDISSQIIEEKIKLKNFKKSINKNINYIVTKEKSNNSKPDFIVSKMYLVGKTETNSILSDTYFVDLNELSNKNKINKLNKIKALANSDTQINTNGKFDEFTDFQNIMLSDLSLLELLWDGNESDLADKNIDELYIESLNSKNFSNIEYDKLIFDGNEMIEMAKEENRDEYKFLVLGKLVRYGFSNIKIKEKISGKDGFDAFVLEDTDGNTMLYFPCTNLVEEADYLYDSYPVLDSLSNKLGTISNLIGAKKIYNSQQFQAKELLNECIKKISSNSKIIVSGFSLGGSLAEVAYLNSYKDNSSFLGNLILFNPYHNRLNNSEIKLLKECNKLKLYVTEGDAVSTVFNYADLSDMAKTVYINYQSCIKDTMNDIDNKQSVLNLIVDNFKNKYCNRIISICDDIKQKTPLNLSLHAALNVVSNGIEKVKKQEIDATNLLKQVNNIVEGIFPVLKKFGFDISENYNLEFLDNLEYVETIFTTTHLTYSVDRNKETSFDQNGNIKSEVEVRGANYRIGYPSFTTTTTKIFGSDPYNELSNMLNDLLK